MARLPFPRVIPAKELIERQQRLFAEGKLDEILAAQRKPRGVSAARWGIAVRMRGELLHARKNAVEAGLNYRQDKPRSTPTMRPRYMLTVKATSAKQAEQGRMGWLERPWRISPLQFKPGFIVFSELGTESNVFPSAEHALTAIRKSGWEIVTKTELK